MVHTVSELLEQGPGGRRGRLLLPLSKTEVILHANCSEGPQLPSPGPSGLCSHPAPAVPQGRAEE